MAGALLEGILSSFIWFVLGGIFSILANYLIRILPAKVLWSINNPKRLIVCVSTSTKTDTGEYVRPATGIGQLRALAHINVSLNKAYAKFQVKNILLSIDRVQNAIENDLILLGGPKNNEITRLFLNKIKKLNIVDQTNSVIEWKVQDNEGSYNGVVKNHKVLTDYGLIIRMKNPFDSKNKSTIALFSGSHTYGTIAAAKYFTDHYIEKKILLRSLKKNIFILVRCDVVDGYPVGIKKIKEVSF